MNLAELKEAYKARKLALDSAKKEEEKYKALLKDAMLEAGESDYTDEAGYRFERIVQERKSMDEEKLLAELHERNLTSCIATKEVVDEDATLKAVEAGELPQEVLADALYEEGKGYIAFSSDRDEFGILAPYIPCGGKRALQSILDAGGFCSFDGMEYVQELGA